MFDFFRKMFVMLYSIKSYHITLYLFSCYISLSDYLYLFRCWTACVLYLIVNHVVTSVWCYPILLLYQVINFNIEILAIFKLADFLCKCETKIFMTTKMKRVPKAFAKTESVSLFSFLELHSLK